MRGMATLPKVTRSYQWLETVGRPPGELGVSKYMEFDIFPFSALTLLVLGDRKGILGVSKSMECDFSLQCLDTIGCGRQEGHPACKKLDVGGDDLTGALHELQLQLSPPVPSSFGERWEKESGREHHRTEVVRPVATCITIDGDGRVNFILDLRANFG